MKTWKTLYGKASNGKIKLWKIAVFECGNNAEIKIQHGYIDGKVSVKTTFIDKGKNIGKVNATTPFTQACSKAESKWKKKKDQGYASSKSKVKSKKVLLPMLAKTYYSKDHPRVIKKEVKEKNRNSPR